MEEVPTLVPIMGMVTGILITLGFFGAIAFAIYMNFRKRQEQSKEIIAAIEKGIEIPFPPPKKRNYLNVGIACTCIGLVFAIALAFSTDSSIGLLWGLLPVALGVAFLLIAYIERRQKESAEQT